MNSYKFLLLSLLVCCALAQREDRRRLQFRFPEEQAFTRPIRFKNGPRFTDEPFRPTHGTKPTPIDPTTILNSRPPPSPPPSFDFQPKPRPTSDPFRAKGPRPVPPSLKIFQIPKFEEESLQEEARRAKPAPPPPPPKPKPKPISDSRFDAALRQVLGSPPPSQTIRFNQRPPVRDSRVDEFTIARPAEPQRPQYTFQTPEAGGLDDFRPFTPRPAPVRIERPPPVRAERPPPVRAERPPPVRDERPPPVRAERPPPVRARRPPPPERRPLPPVEEEPEFQYVINPNQHQTLVKEEAVANKPVDFIDAKLRRKPIQVTSSYMNKNADGTFTFGYTGEDGSFKEETRGNDCVVRGKYGYIDPAGIKREFTYETGNPCDPETKLPVGQTQEEQGYYDYNKGVYVTATGQEVPLQVQRQRKTRRI